LADAREACLAALEYIQQFDITCSQPPRLENATCVHRWPFLKRNYLDLVLGNLSVSFVCVL